jgi:hypothetical protein
LIGGNKKPPEGGFLLSLNRLFHSFDHVFNDLLSVTKDHHGLVHVEQLVI